METLNDFMSFWFAYPSPYNALDVAFSEENSPNTPENVRSWIYATFKNSCCIRLSHSLNSSICHTIPKNTRARTVVGAKGNYIYAVPDFSNYLKDRYGNPTHIWPDPKDKWKKIGERKTKLQFRQELKKKRGIILFFDYVGGARGHADLQDKGEVGSYDLFDAIDRVEFWEVKP